MPSSSESAAPSACPESSVPPALGGPGISRLSSFLSRSLTQLQPQNSQPDTLGFRSTACAPSALLTPAGTQASALPGASPPKATGMAVSSPESAQPAPSQPPGSAGHRSGLPSYKMRLLGLQDVRMDSFSVGDEAGQGAQLVSSISGGQGGYNGGANLDGRTRGTQPAGGSNSSAAEPGENLQQSGPSSQAQRRHVQKAEAPEPAVAGFGAVPGCGVAAMAIPTMMALAAAGPPSEPLLLEAAGLRLQVPASINCHLRDYQRDGVRFLFRQFSQGKGGILADDMGLGKTIQSIGERLLASPCHIPPLLQACSVFMVSLCIPLALQPSSQPCWVSMAMSGT